MRLADLESLHSQRVLRAAALPVIAISSWLVAWPAPAMAADDLLPIEAFARNPDIGAARLSPSGKYLAITTSTRTSRKFLAVVSLDDASPPKVLANFSDVDIRSFRWVNDERLVFNTIDTETALNDQRFGPGLYSVKRDGSGLRTLISGRFQAVVSERSRIGTQTLGPDHQLMATLEDGSDDVIVAQYDGTVTGELDAVVPMRLDTATGHASVLSLGSPPHPRSWVLDGKGRPRVVATRFEGNTRIFWRDLEHDRWKPIADYREGSERFVPLAVDDAGQLLVEGWSKKGEGVLERFDFEAGKPSDDAIVSVPGFDLLPRLRLEPQSGRLLGVGYESDAGATIWFDPALKKLQAAADARFPGHVNELQCRRCETDGVLLVFSYSDQDPGTYHLYRAKDQSWETIGKARADLDPARMAQVDFYRASARDGEDLPVWVTATPSSGGKPRPAVLLAHGGPWVRGGGWHWDADAQFLASRGYVVIEPEFRGSAGYGRSHLRKGFKQWGLAMQDDLADAVRWAAGKGLIDPDRVCIAGASYGGYATIMGLVRNPDVFRCGIAWVAVTDPRLLFENSWSNDMPAEVQRYSLPRMIGDPVKDAALLKDASAVEHAGEIKAPLLLAYGGNDVRVPIEHGSTMRSALRKAGNEPEYVVYDGEGHGFLKLENRVDFYRRMERFLAKNLQ